MRLPETKGASSRRRSFVAVVGMIITWIALGASAQDQPPPLPPPLPHIVQGGPQMSSPTFELADQADQGFAENVSKPPVRTTATASPLPVREERPAAQESVATPILAPLTDYMQLQQDEEIQRLHELKANISQVRKIIQAHKRREEEARTTAMRARQREAAALQTAREAQQRDREVEAQKQELLRLMRQLEQREQNLRREQRERELAGGRSEGAQPKPTATTNPLPPEPPGSPSLNTLDATASNGTSKPSAVAITAGAVDQRALADNLFGAAEYKLAADIYQQLLGQQANSKEAAWFRLQTANCFRHLGNHELAASYYREVVADSSDPFLADTAKWWLAAIQKRRTVKQRAEELAMLMDQVSNKLDAELE